MALSKEKAEPLGWGGGVMVGEGGEVGGAGGRGSPPRTLYLTSLRCSVPWATQEVEQVGSVTGGWGGGGGKLCFTCGLGVSFPDFGADQRHGAHGACILAPWEI